MNILVFKTNIRYKKHLNKIVPYLNSTSEIIRWNVDFHDKDKILRIEANNLHPQSVEMVLQRAGYYCEELED
jgi:Ran GTPase-activating protein (RanGAP) involved in mRNA processing and transport